MHRLTRPAGRKARSGQRRAALILAVAAGLFSLLPAAPGMAQRQQVREIIDIGDGLYRTRNGNWYGVMLVTDAGILIGDPINNAFAEWLSAEIASRFDVPVRYVVYSHSHFDHAEGGRFFADTATFIGHEKMLRNMDGRFPQMPGDMIDRDQNGVFDFSDIDIPTNAAPGICGFSRGFFTMFDHDGDDRVTPAEMQRDIVPPDIVYSDRMRLTLGGVPVELIYPGQNHADDATVVWFPEHRAVFATEFLADALVTDNVRSLPSACGPFDGSPLAEWVRSYRTVEAIDFDTVLPGHGDSFEKQAVTDTRQYFEDLVQVVSAAMADGLTLEQLIAGPALQQYADWANYERLRARNLDAAWRNLQLYR